MDKNSKDSLVKAGKTVLAFAITTLAATLVGILNKDKEK